MIRVGIGVEGPSDKAFWEKVLHRCFPGCLFTIINLSGKTRLARTAPTLADELRHSGYAAAFFLLDADKSPCVALALDLFDEGFRKSACEQPVLNRFANIAVAFRELESWVLADEECVRELFDFPAYKAPASDARPAGKAGFLRLCQNNKKKPLSGLEDREFASRVGSRFSPSRARKNSASFDYFWSRLTLKIQAARSTQ